MRIRLQHIALALLLGAVPASADAKISKELKAELSTYITELETSQNDETIRAVALSRALVQDKKAAQAALEPLKKDPRVRVRIAAAFGLMETGDRKADDFIVGQLKSSEQALPVLEEVVSIIPDKTEASILEDTLKGATPVVARDVLRYLVAQEGKLFDLYVDTLRSGKHRKEAMQAALASTRPELVEPAKKLLSSKNADDRRDGAAIAIAMSRVPGRTAVATPLLHKAAGDKESKVRQPAAERLLEMGDPKGAEALLANIGSEEPAAQALTLTAVRDSGVKVSAASVKDLMASENEDVKLLAYQLSAKEASVTKEILEKLSSTDPNERMLALKVAGYTDSVKAAEYLAGSLFEGRADVRRISAEGLAVLGKPVALEQLKMALDKEPDLETRLAVIEALGAIGNKQAIQVLRFKSKDRNEKIKMAIVEALIATGKKDAVKALELMTRERNAEIQWAAFMGMIRLDYKAATAKFDRLFRNPEPGFLADIDAMPPAIRKRIYTYLLTENKGAPRDAALVAALRTGEFEDQVYEQAMNDNLLPKVRRDVLLKLAARGNKKDLIVLENVARQSTRPEMSHLAAWLLMRHPDKGQEATYRGFLVKKDETLKGIATFGLGFINK